MIVFALWWAIGQYGRLDGRQKVYVPWVSMEGRMNAPRRIPKETAIGSSALIGGGGTIWGPVLGALALHAIADTAHAWVDTPGFAPMLYGVLLLVIIGFLPGGIAGLRRA